jgi:hypothetical protein
LKIGFIKESFHFSGKTEVTRNFLIIKDKGIEKAEAQVFKIFEGTTSGPWALDVSISKKIFSTFSTENYIVPNRSLEDTTLGPG